MGTTFEPHYDDHVMEEVYKNVPQWSQITLFSEFEIEKFEKLVDELFQFEYNTEKQDMYTAKKNGKLIYFYKNKTRFGKDIAIFYNVSNKLENDDDPENEEVEDIDFNEIVVKENICTDVIIYYNVQTKSKVDTLIEKLNDIVYLAEDKHIFYTIGVNSYGFKLMDQEINFTKTDIAYHYGKDFLNVHEEILNNLTTKFHGLFLFHGDPGTGKTSYVRYLISELSKTTKKVIYIPAYMIEQMANPEFITFLQKHKESILILEDAEFALQSRAEEYGAQAVSNLLNITNGLLNDATKIQVIATFNMDKKKLDEALLRPGRLLNEWKFGKLSIEDAKALAAHLEKDLEITEPMTVAEIYEGKVQSNKKKKKSIGF